MSYDDYLYYNRAAEPISRDEYVQLFGRNDEERESYRRVAETQIGPYWVSTVWLGINHRFTEEGPPIIFETMVFAHSSDAPDLGPDIDMDRYCTEEEALAGHEAMCTLIRATIQEEFTNEGNENAEDHSRQEDPDRDDQQEPGGAPGAVPSGSGEVPGEGDRAPGRAPGAGSGGEEGGPADPAA